MGYQVNLRSLDSEQPITELRGVQSDGVFVPIAKGDGFVVISLNGENVSVITTGLNAEGIVNMLRRLHLGIPQIIEKIIPPAPPKAVATPPVSTMTQRIEIPTETLVKLLKGRGLDVGAVEEQLAAKKVDQP